MESLSFTNRRMASVYSLSPRPKAAWLVSAIITPFSTETESAKLDYKGLSRVSLGRHEQSTLILTICIIEDCLMSEPERVELIREIEKARGSRVIALFYGDRPIAGTSIADDALRPLYDHLLSIQGASSEGSERRKIDLVLYTRGGAVETPWKMVTKIRQFSSEFTVTIPFRAYSAGTMIALGADKILMSPMSEMGPIDPSLQTQPGALGNPFLIPDPGVEDVAAYVTFLTRRAGISDQAPLAETIKVLAEHLTPTLLGRLERTYSHIRLVARKLLSLASPPYHEASIDAISEALTEKMYAHGHGIGVDEAAELGLRAERMDSSLESLVWQLYLNYEAALKLDATADPEGYFRDDATNSYEESDAVGVFMESREVSHQFCGKIQLQRIRQIPSPLNLNINMPLSLPPSIQPENIPAELQQVIQQMLQQALPELQRMVESEIARQAPVQGLQAKWIGGGWKQVR